MQAKKSLFRIILSVILVIAAAAILLGALFFFLAPRCMGVKILSQRQAEKFTAYTYTYTDLHQTILLDGSPAAIDVETSTLYIPQTITAETEFSALAGKLTCIARDYKLYFAPDEAFETLSTAVETGHPFRLLLSADRQTYMQYTVIFTTLPILRLDGDADTVNEDGEDLYAGELCLWGADSEAREQKTSAVEWHVRGWSSQMLPKKSWKLTLKTEGGDNRDLSLLGLGSDDDWILNPLSFDDQKVRENLTAAIWERMSEDADYPLPMAAGQYVEVVLNGKYHGLYLLQRRIDRKFLSLGGEDILLKSKQDYTPQSVEQAYEVIYSAKGEAYAYEVATPFFKTFDPASICLENWIDLELLLQLGNMPDNSGYKNMYYLWHEGKIYFLPWDVDMSFGMTYNEGIVYDASVTQKLCRHRQEYEALQAIYPDLDARIAARWQELREDWLTEETLLAIADGYWQSLRSAGVIARDNLVWGVYAGDTVEQMEAYIRGRIAFLDGYYAELS